MKDTVGTGDALLSPGDFVILPRNVFCYSSRWELSLCLIVTVYELGEIGCRTPNATSSLVILK